MSDQEKKSTTPPTPVKRGKRPRKESNLKALSFQVPAEVHDMLNTAGDEYMLDKAGVARLALRVFIAKYYQGGGVWQLPPDVEEHIVYASSGVHFARGLKQ